MRNGNLAKKGVSLVTVLIFMMIASIAATATYKWLASAGFTSADRLAMSEAKEASHAGLESVRSWMTYHANDVGAILRQYYDGGKKPVALTNVVRGMNTSKQVFKVWLTGVETSGNSYKFTIVSNGVAHGSAKYSETSVLNVRGLYKVKEPSVVVQKPVNFKQSYFGGTTSNTGGVTNTSMIINGSWSGNPPRVEEDFVVTGNATLSGSDIRMGKHGCVGGNLNSQNEGVHVTDLYVKGNTTQAGGDIRGNAVFEGNVGSTSAGPGLNVEGDLTFKGTYTTERTKATTVKGNFCVERNGRLNIGDLYQEFRVNKNVNVKTSSLFQNSLDKEYVKKTNLGGNGFSIYMPNLGSCSSDWHKGCENGWMYQGYSSFFKSSATPVTVPTTAMFCDTSIINYCNDILGPRLNGKGCNGTNYKIKDMITTAYSSFHQLVDRVSCANISSNTGNYNVSSLNTCYTNTLKTPTLMYHGYLVVGLHGGSDGTIFKNPSGTLNGNFIFIADGQNPLGQIKLPPTTASSNVFVYLNAGASDVNAVERSQGSFNYFVYSKGNINVLHNDSRNKTWNGSFYMTAETCAKISDLNTGGMKLYLNETLLQNLIDSTVICGYDELGSCGSLVTNGGDDVNNEGEEMNKDAGFDRYYVATAPQLSITLESQRRNRETLYENLTSKEYTTVKPSIVILPRIVYLSDTPEGKLENYYKVINLNGAKEKFSASNTKCTPNLTTTGPIISAGDSLGYPVYKCEYTAKTKSYGTVPFWVVVDAQAAKKSPVSFAGSESRIFGGGSVTVSMEVGNDQHDAVSVVVRADEVPEGWELHKVGDYVVPGEVQNDGSRFYTITLLPGMTTPVFQVKANANADVDQINFIITSTSENARIGDAPSHSVWLNGAATVQRVDIPRTGYCDNSKHKMVNGVSCTDIVSRPECEGNLVITSVGEWVQPNCVGITTQDPNNQWGCGLSNANEVKLEEQSMNVSPYCDVFIPDSSIENMRDGQTYTFYASYKAKLFTLKVALNGASDSKVDVRYSKQIINDAPPEQISKKTCSAKDTCIIPIFAGYNVDVTARNATGEKFKFWKFLHAQTSDSISQENPMAISLRRDTTVIAEFDEIENHCFYTDFKDVQIWCDGTTDDCVDKCKNPSKNTACETNGGGNYPTSKWLIPRTNNGQNYKKPDIDQSGFIYYSKGNNNNANSGNSTITYLLNRAQAGGHGTLTSLFKACYREKKGNNYSPLNSGFMLRSTGNSSQYSIVQIYGRASQVNNVGKDVMEVRVCEGDGSGIKNENSGDCQKATFPRITITKGQVASIVFNTDIEVFGDSAKVKLSYKRDDGTWERDSVNIPLLVGANVDEYVGLSMADDCFKVMNLGWESDEWGADSCFDVPKMSCSFSANYLGGILPLNEDVKPWVGTSNYFNDPNNPDKLRAGCSLTYHYNGCDLAGGYATNKCEKWQDGVAHCSSCSADSDGPYYVSGVFANSLKIEKNDRYKFTYAGLHGVSKNYDYNGSSINGAVRDASVTIDCSDVTHGGNGHTYEASCGRFVVGNINECSQGSSFDISNCRNEKSCVASVSGGIANLRSSSILGEISGLPDDEGPGNQTIVSMVMTDANGLKSQEFRISGNGPFSRDVNLMSDMQEFDPEKIVSIEFTSSKEFTVASLSSDCPNSVGLHGCSAMLEDDRFVIMTNVVNAGGAKCKVDGVGNSFSTEERNCPADGRFYIPAVDLQKSLNVSGGSRSFTFNVTIKPKDGGETQTCTTPAIEALPNVLTCSLSSDAPINPGDNLPSLNYQITNCPAAGCAIEARIGSEAPVRLVYRGNGQVNSWSPNVNTTAGNYRYTLSYAGLTCTADITVVTGANGSTAENCAIDEVSKRFTADLNLAVGNTNTIKLWYMDKLGHIIDRSKNVSPSTTRFDEPLPTMTEAGDYIVALSINGEEVCSVPYTFAEEEPAPDAECYIENGRFKTRNKNTSGASIQTSLNRNQDGTPYGNTVSSGSWPDGGYLDLDAYVPMDPGTYTYNLWGSGVLCSVTYEVKNGTEENP